MHSIDQGSVSRSPLTKQKILDVYADVFEGLGTFPGEPYKFKLKENYVPARHTPRKVPIHLQDDFHEEINDLVKQGVLEKVEHSTEWVNSCHSQERCFHGQWKFPSSMSSIQEEATNLFRSKRSK